jgi:hypothetical protein
MSGNSKAIDAGQLAARQWERQGCDQSRRDNDCHRVDVGRVLEDRAEIPRAADEIGTCCLAGACALAEDDIDVFAVRRKEGLHRGRRRYAPAVPVAKHAIRTVSLRTGSRFPGNRILWAETKGTKHSRKYSETRTETKLTPISRPIRR